MTLDENLVARLDKVVKTMGTSRSAFAREAIENALLRLKEEELDRKHRAGYERHPVNAEEFAVWEDEQAWGDK